MNPDDPFERVPTDTPDMAVAVIPLADSIAEVYESAPPAVRNWMLNHVVVVAFKSAPPLVRKHLLERLIRPLGLLSLAAVAGGVFAQIRLRSGWENLQVQIDDVQSVNTRDLMPLRYLRKQKPATLERPPKEKPRYQCGSGVSLCGLAERVGFEPTVPCGTPDFESGTFGHSATSP